MKLYQSNFSPYSVRPRIALRVKGVTDLELVTPPGGAGSDEFRAINPTGKIPFLELEEGAIAESAVICEYIEERWPTPSLFPEGGPFARAQCRMLVQAIDVYVMLPLIRAGRLLPNRDANKDQIDALIAEFTNGLKLVDALREKSGLAGEQYAIGAGLTIADCAFAGVLFFVKNFAIPRMGLGDIMPPRLAKLYAFLETAPFTGDALGEMMEELKKLRQRQQQQKGG